MFDGKTRGAAANLTEFILDAAGEAAPNSKTAGMATSKGNITASASATGYSSFARALNLAASCGAKTPMREWRPK